MKAVLIGVLSVGMIAFATSAFADHHNNNSNSNGGGHQSHQSHSGGGGFESHSNGHINFHASSGGFERFGGRHENVHVTVHHNTLSHHNIGHVAIHGVHHGAVHARVSMAHFHHVFRAPHRYHIGVWRAPRGFHYRRFGIGERIPALLFVPTFFLLDYYDYGLDEPDDGYVWVRDGDDALLVDRYTGEVVEVEYDVFY